VEQRASAIEPVVLVRVERRAVNPLVVPSAASPRKRGRDRVDRPRAVARMR